MAMARHLHHGRNKPRPPRQCSTPIRSIRHSPRTQGPYRAAGPSHKASAPARHRETVATTAATGASAYEGAAPASVARGTPAHRSSLRCCTLTESTAPGAYGAGTRPGFRSSLPSRPSRSLACACQSRGRSQCVSWPLASSLRWPSHSVPIEPQCPGQHTRSAPACPSPRLP